LIGKLGLAGGPNVERALVFIDEFMVPADAGADEGVDRPLRPEVIDDVHHGGVIAVEASVARAIDLLQCVMAVRVLQLNPPVRSELIADAATDGPVPVLEQRDFLTRGRGAVAVEGLVAGKIDGAVPAVGRGRRRGCKACERGERGPRHDYTLHI
jgi:hypothetical protein